ncbi:MAG: hypothetical protein VKJ02_15330 [Snowella sp.]|nr:hypothetical protein [Snowella sp.]
MIISQEKPTITTEAKTFVTLEEYRAIAETSEERYEYCDGEMIVMPGGTATRSAIAFPSTLSRKLLIRK